MKKYGISILVMIGVFLLLSADTFAGTKQESVQTFENISRITISTVSGDCIINKGQGKQVTLEIANSYRPRDSFEPKIRTSGSTLRLSEEIYESNSGSSTWTLTIPDGIQIDFTTASGDLSITGLQGVFSASTASGDVEIEGCSGEFEFSTASGDITVSDCHGEFRLATASGNIDAAGVVLDNESSFATASGRVDVALAATAEYDLNVGTASGSAILDYGGNELRGMFELEAKVRSGRIKCPIDFDSEKTFSRNGQKYIRKTFTRGTDTPMITIGTASGRAELKEG